MIDNFTTWFSSMELLLQVFWVFAIVSSLFFVVQLVMTLIGIDGGDVDTDVSGFDADAADVDGFSLFTVKNFIHFALGIGWTGVSLWNVIPNRYVLILIALLVGVVLVMVFLWLFRKLMKLESRGSYNPADCVGSVADVYIPIPAERSGTGKVQLSIRSAVVEMDAQTNGDRLSTGTKVRVTELLNSHTVVVEKL